METWEWDGRWSSQDEWQTDRMQKALEAFDERANQREAEQDAAWAKHLKRLDRRRK